MAGTPQPVHRTGPLVPTPTPLPTPGGPRAPQAKPVPHAPGAPGHAELPAAGPARPLAGAGPGGAAAGPPARHGHHGTAKKKQRHGWGRTGLHELRSGGLNGGLQAPPARYHGAQAVQAHGPHGAGVRGRGRHHGCRGGMASATAAPRPLPRRAALLASCKAERRRHPSQRSSYTSSRRRCWQTAGRVSSTTTARRRSREAYKGRSAMHPAHGTPHSTGAIASETLAAAHPLPTLSRGRHWCCRQQATRPSYTATPEGIGRTS